MSNPRPKTSVEYLNRAVEVQTERAKEYNQSVEGGERSMTDIVAAFNALTGHKVTETEGWMFLQILKMKRLMTGRRHHEDSALDNVSYAALVAESSVRSHIKQLAGDTD